MSDSAIRFEALLRRPGGNDRGAEWCFLRLPQQASDRLPSRGMVSVAGFFEEVSFVATLAPDGEGGHWLRVEPALLEATNSRAGDPVRLEIAPVEREPEPVVPPALEAALASAPAAARETWNATTPIARRDWIQWITSAKREETRIKRLAAACDMLAKGKRRPCCFDRSGMYDKSLACPVAAEG